MKKNFPYAFFTAIISLLTIFLYINIFRFFWPSGDAVNYARDIDLRAVHDWWSALYTLEALFLINLFDLFSVNVNGEEAVSIITSVCIIIFFVSCYFLTVRLFSNGIKRWFFLLIIDTVVIFFALLPFSSNLDLPALSMLVAALTVSLYVGASSGRSGIIVFLVILMSILLIHAISFKKVNVLLSPFIVITAFKRVLAISNFARYIFCISVALLISVFFMMLPKPFYHLFGGYVNSYPMEPMIRSDIYTSGLLRGDFSVINFLNSRLPTNRKIYNVGSNYTFGALSEDEWHILRGEWVREWINHSDSMLHARALQIMQFVFGSVLPSSIIEYYHENYPNVPSLGETRNGFHWYTYVNRNKYDVANYLLWVNLFIHLLCIPVGFILVVSCRRSGCIRSFMQPPCIFSLLAIMANFSYVSVVVPTGDLRYKYPILFFSVLSIVSFVMSCHRGRGCLKTRRHV